MTTEIAIVLGIIVLMSISFFTELLPLAFTAFMVPVLLQATGILGPAEAWSGFSNTTCITWIGLFILGAMFAKTSFTYKIKMFVTRNAQGSGVKVFAMIVLASTVLAVVTSATSAIAVLAPIISEICRETGVDEKKTFKAVSDLGTWGAVMTLPMGSTLTYIMLANSWIANAGSDAEFGLMDFVLIKLPMWLVLFVYFLLINRRMAAKSAPERAQAQETAEARHTVYTPLQDKLAMWIFGLNVVLMVAVTFTKIMPSYLVSSFFAVLAVGLKLLSEKEALSSVSWSTIFLVAGTLPLSNAISSSGTGAWLAEIVRAAIPAATNPVVLAAAFCVITAVCTQFMSNGAVWSTFGPIAASMAVVYGLDPRLVLSGVMVGAIICFATPMATTSGAYAYGYCKFSMREFIRLGWLPCVLMVLIFLVWAPVALGLLY